MFKPRPHTQTVKGHRLPSPRLTGAGYRAVALYLVAPFLVFLLLLDILLYLLFRFGFDSCYGVLCWL